MWLIIQSTSPPRCSSMACQVGELTITVLLRIPGHLVNPRWSVVHIFKYVAITLPLFSCGFTHIYNLCWKTEVLRATVHCTINLIKYMAITTGARTSISRTALAPSSSFCMMFGLCLFLLTKLPVIKLFLIGIMTMDAHLQISFYLTEFPFLIFKTNLISRAFKLLLFWNFILSIKKHA